MADAPWEATVPVTRMREIGQGIRRQQNSFSPLKVPELVAPLSQDAERVL